jgi:uncharacterized protein YlxW (UPF0749 family)
MIMLAAGLLFTTSATTAAGTALREDRLPEINQLLEKRQAQVDANTAHAEELRRQVDALTTQLAGGNGPIAEQMLRGESYRKASGFAAVHGPGLTVRLDDAKRLADGSFPDAASQDALVVHQQDVESVVNALWAGGAEAMTIMGRRVISTTAVRCVGNTLLLDGRRYSPEFVISAIGDQARMRAALSASPGVRDFEAAVRDYGLGYQVTDEKDIIAPAYQGSAELRHATVPK